MSDFSGRNSHGLFDAPVRCEESEVVGLDAEILDRQLEAGAFLMPREEARRRGFLSPYDEQDTVTANIQ